MLKGFRGLIRRQKRSNTMALHRKSSVHPQQISTPTWQIALGGHLDRDWSSLATLSIWVALASPVPLNLVCH